MRNDAAVPDITSLSISHKSEEPRAIGLLDLPAKIRIKIWNYTLCQSPADALKPLYGNGSFDPQVLNHLSTKSWFTHHAYFENDVEPRVLRACKLIYHEATPIFYSNAIIHTMSIGTATLPDKFKSLVRRLEHLARPRPYNIKNIFLILIRRETARNDPKEHDYRDASMIAYYADTLSKYCGVLETLHIQIIDRCKEFLKPFDNDRVISLMRGFGILQARKAAVSMFALDAWFSIKWIVEQEGPTVPLEVVYQYLCRTLKISGIEVSRFQSLPKLEYDDQLPGATKGHVRMERPTREHYNLIWKAVFRKALRILDEDGNTSLDTTYDEADSNSSDDLEVNPHDTDCTLQNLQDSFEQAVLAKARSRMSDKRFKRRVNHLGRMKQFKDLLEGRDALLQASRVLDESSFEEFFYFYFT